MMASAKEATDVIFVANGRNHTYKPLKNRDLIFDAQAPVLGNSVFHHSFIKIAEVIWPEQIVFNFRDTLIITSHCWHSEAWAHTFNLLKAFSFIVRDR